MLAFPAVKWGGIESGVLRRCGDSTLVDNKVNTC